MIIQYKDAEILYELSKFGLKVIIKGMHNGEVEIGINIRKKTENFHLRSYSIEWNELRDAYIVKDSEGRSLVVSGIEIKERFYKEHNPFPFEKQRCYVIKGTITHTIYLSSSIDDFDKLISKAHEDDLTHYSRLLNEKASSLNITPRASKKEYVEELLNTWFWAVDSILSLKKKDYYVAGLPWFDEFWSRDALWNGFALLALDMKDDIKNMLLFLGNRINEHGHMLTLLNPDGTSSYHGDDILPLYLIIAKYYLLKYKDKEVEKQVLKVLKIAEKYLHEHLFNGIVVHRSTGTWMDTISKEWSALDIQALWTKAAKCWKHQSKKMRLFYEILLKGLIKFYDGEKWYRFLDPSSYKLAVKDTANVFLLTFFDLVSGSYKDAVLQRGKILLSDYGVALENPENYTFDPKGYHNGASWFLVNGWALVSYLQNGYKKEAKLLLDAFIRDYKRFAYGNFSEVVAWDSGELIGSPHQLWSASMFVVAMTFGLQNIVFSERWSLAYPSFLEDIANIYSSPLANHVVEGDEIVVKCSIPCYCTKCYMHGNDFIFKRGVVLYDIERGN
ncbi:MAG: hypothetical protein GXN99_02645 [Candidatus Nanohaloarchaeota archaeon]|nr:hypothetical protein [Candidatus Nanohaloarchaeota archaeon]